MLSFILVTVRPDGCSANVLTPPSSPLTVIPPPLLLDGGQQERTVLAMLKPRNALCLLALVSTLAACSQDQQRPDSSSPASSVPAAPEAASTSSSVPTVIPTQPEPSTESTVPGDSALAQDQRLAPLTPDQVVAPDNIYAVSAANAIVATLGSSIRYGSFTWEDLLEASAAVYDIEYPSIVEGLEVLTIDESALRVLMTFAANTDVASGYSEAYVCFTPEKVSVSEYYCE
jgi:hypothetical protein